MDAAVSETLEKYDTDDLTIGTLGSHSALNILKGAKEEGFRTVCVCQRGSVSTYTRFPVADHIIPVDDIRHVLREETRLELKRKNTILVPHGSFSAYLTPGQLVRELDIPLFGNRWLLAWEAHREKQEEWLRMAGLRQPRTFRDPSQIRGLTIAKFPGAKGGRGYFLATSPESLKERGEDMVRRGLLRPEDLGELVLQDYIVGVTIYPSYFHSILDAEVELLGVDRRYESGIDGMWRIPAREQLEANLNPTYTVVGNIPITLRESLLAEYLEIGDRVVEASKRIAEPGLIGPYSLETVVTDSMEIYTFEISARIVAGTNTGIGGSPYSYLKHGEGMYMGRRIAKEIRKAVEIGRLRETLT